MTNPKRSPDLLPTPPAVDSEQELTLDDSVVDIGDPVVVSQFTGAQISKGTESVQGSEDNQDAIGNAATSDREDVSETREPSECVPESVLSSENCTGFAATVSSSHGDHESGEEVNLENEQSPSASRISGSVFVNNEAPMARASSPSKSLGQTCPNARGVSQDRHQDLVEPKGNTLDTERQQTGDILPGPSQILGKRKVDVRDSLQEGDAGRACSDHEESLKNLKSTLESKRGLRDRLKEGAAGRCAAERVQRQIAGIKKAIASKGGAVSDSTDEDSEPSEPSTPYTPCALEGHASGEAGDAINLDADDICSCANGDGWIEAEIPHNHNAIDHEECGEAEASVSEGHSIARGVVVQNHREGSVETLACEVDCLEIGNKKPRVDRLGSADSGNVACGGPQAVSIAEDLMDSSIEDGSGKGFSADEIPPMPCSIYEPCADRNAQGHMSMFPVHLNNPGPKPVRTEDHTIPHEATADETGSGPHSPVSAVDMEAMNGWSEELSLPKRIVQASLIGAQKHPQPAVHQVQRPREFTNRGKESAFLQPCVGSASHAEGGKGGLTHGLNHGHPSPPMSNRPQPLIHRNLESCITQSTLHPSHVKGVAPANQALPICGRGVSSSQHGMGQPSLLSGALCGGSLLNAGSSQQTRFKSVEFGKDLDTVGSCSEHSVQRPPTYKTVLAAFSPETGSFAPVQHMMQPPLQPPAQGLLPPRPPRPPPSPIPPPPPPPPPQPPPPKMIPLPVNHQANANMSQTRGVANPPMSAMHQRIGVNDAGANRTLAVPIAGDGKLLGASEGAPSPTKFISRLRLNADPLYGAGQMSLESTLKHGRKFR